ncbi:helix-turn-helix transcriptional regulator [Conchiformibius steedae DSM 2580]|uniref:Helix-turn-helix transcriptional regulator n=1 Tax=Conchiformibius steedae DSM 2580 TaxID=1121352 RepID=A0AAE9HW14_9NEIS|nr:helix-turn-helix transcriptional regulator [Conchiformibius steedae]QMT34014.1 helix-turn-helix transcriptional regulator [Conchiformibius steedae]URD66785.1 helix-turn-helix transcriptional regulator [Conchiformibius steedae DSM 2580]
MEIHNKIRLLRELNGWSQEKVAEQLDMSASGYAKIERGETQPNIIRLQQIAAVFQIDLWELLKSEQGNVILQINEDNSNGDISCGNVALYAPPDISVETAVLKKEIEFLKNILQQKDKEIEWLRKRIEQTESE